MCEINEMEMLYLQILSLQEKVGDTNTLSLWSMVNEGKQGHYRQKPGLLDLDEP